MADLGTRLTAATASKADEGTDLETLRAGLTSAIEPFAAPSLVDAEEFAGWLAGTVTIESVLDAVSYV